MSDTSTALIEEIVRLRGTLAEATRLLREVERLAAGTRPWLMGDDAYKTTCADAGQVEADITAFLGREK